MVNKSLKSYKKVLNIIEAFYLYEKSKSKNFYLLDNKNQFNELIDKSSYLIKIKELSNIKKMNVIAFSYQSKIVKRIIKNN